MAGPVEWLQGTWPALVAFLLAPATLVGLTTFSLVTCLVSLFGVSWVLRRLPVDYLMTAPSRSTTRCSISLTARRFASPGAAPPGG